MNFLFFLLRASRVLIFLVVFTGMISGATNAGFIAIVNSALHNVDTSTTVLVWSFVGLGLAKLVSSAISRILVVRFAHQSVASLAILECISGDSGLHHHLGANLPFVVR